MQPLVTVETFSRVIDARLAQARLEGAGIRTFLADESVASIDPFLINAIGGVKLQVELTDEAAAREILSTPLEDGAGGDVDESAPLCPRCDSEYVFGTQLFKCRRCGFEGEASEFVPAKDRPKGAGGNRLTKGPAAGLPVYRLERRRGLVGGLVGFFVGFILTIFLGREIGVLGLLLGMFAGIVLGRSWKYWVCSEPTCRGPLEPTDGACGRCGRTVRGAVSKEGEHFRRVTEWQRAQGTNGKTR
jgi:hypothetical protein